MHVQEPYAGSSLSLTRRIALALGSVVAMVVLMSGVSIGVLLAVLWHFEPLSARLHDGRRAVLVGHEGMLDQETGLRGYLIARDPAFLEPTHAGRLAVAAANDVVSKTLAADADLAPLFMNKRLAEQRWTDEWARPVETIPTDEPGEVTAAQGKALFDAYRVCENALLATLDERVSGVDADRRMALEIGAMLTLSILVGAVLFTAWQRRAIGAAVTEPLACLLEAIHQVRDGARQVRAPVTGPDELRQIAEGLNEMTAALADERARREAQEQQVAAQSKRLRLILDSAREFSESLNLRYVLQSVGRAAAAVIPGEADVTIWLLDGARSKLVAVYDSARPKESPRGIDPITMGDGVEGRAAKFGRTIIEPPSDARPDLVAASGFPMVVGARVIGVIAIRPTPGPRPRNLDIVDVVETLASHAGSAIESAQLHQATDERSKVDPLTTLFNRRRLDEDLINEVDRSARYGRPLSLLMIDVDHFKAYNDKHGHVPGDIALQLVAEVMRGTVRSTDSVYRYGGEEFVILLRETPLAGAQEFAERLRLSEARRFAGEPENRRLTISIGAAQLDPARPTPGALLEAADGALYQAKRGGRNRVVAATSEPTGTAVLASALSEGRARSGVGPS